MTHTFKPTPRDVLAILAALIMITSVMAPAVALSASSNAVDASGPEVEASVSNSTNGSTSSGKSSVVSQHVRELVSEAESGDTGSELVTQSAGETRVTVTVEAAPGEASTVADLVTAYGSVTSRFRGTVEASVRTEGVDAIANSSAVNVIRLPTPAVATDQGTTVSEGLSNMNVSSDLHAAGYNGSGITVAVVDSGFNVTNPEIEDHVAGFTDYDGDNTNATGAHGTAVAELIVDTAPNVSLLLYDADTGTHIGNAIENITKNTNVDVGSMSLALLRGPGDGSSSIDAAIDDSVGSGVTWFVSSGNYGDGQHYNQTWSDTNGDGWLNVPSGADSIEVQADSGFRAYVNWNASGEDYDVYLNQSGTTIDKSTDPQPRFGPHEVVSADGGSYTLGIENHNANGTADFDIFVTDAATLAPNTSARSVAHPATAKRALAVGAVYHRTNELERFSSRGPTIDGRVKPELVAPDGVETSQPSDSGLNPFSGTSAAAPHAAGVAALVLDSVDGAISPTDVRDSLLASATHLHGAVPNNQTGYGLVNATGAVGTAIELSSGLRITRGSITPEGANASATVNHDVNVTARNVTASGDSVTFRIRFPDSFGLNPNSASVVDGEGNAVSIASSIEAVDGLDDDGITDTLRFGVQPGRSGARIDLTGSVNVDVTHPSVSTTTEFPIYGQVNDTNAPAAAGPETIAGVTVRNGTGSVDIVQTAGYTRSDGFNTSKQVGVVANQSLELNGGADYQFRVTNEDSGHSVTLAANGSMTIPSETFIGFGLYRGDGAPLSSPVIFSKAGRMDLNNVSGPIPAASGLTNFSVSLLNGTGSELARTARRPGIVGYSGVLSQNSTTGQVQFSIPRSVAPVNSTVELLIAHQDGIDDASATMRYNETSDAFDAVLDASELRAGNYSWDVNFGFDGFQALQIQSHFTVNQNIQLQRAAMITGQVRNASGDPAINDTVVAFARDASDASLPELSVVAQTLTNETGNFSLGVPKNGEYDIAYLQGSEASGDLIPRDGSPDIYGLTQVTVSENDVSLDSPFQLEGAHDLNVSVVDESGSPVENAPVAYFHAAGESYESSGVAGGDLSTNTEGLADVSTEENVSRTVPGLEVTGNVTVFVGPPEGEERFVDRIYERNRTVDSDTNLTITLNETVVEITGQVYNASNSPAVNDTVVAYTRAEDGSPPTVSTAGEALINDTGYFTLTVPEKGEYDLAYLQGDMINRENLFPRDGSPDIYGLARVTVGESDVSFSETFQLEGAHDLNVSVLDESGDPVENATVGAFHAAGESYASSGLSGVENVTAADGRFDVSGIENVSRSVAGLEVVGNVTVFVRPPESEERFVDRIYERNVTVTGDDQITVTIKERHTVTGTLVNDTNDPIAGSSVGANGPTFRVVTTNSSGSFAVDVRSGAGYSLGFVQRDADGNVTKRDGTVDLYEFRTVNTSTDEDVGTVTIPDGYVLNVSVVDESGTPVENATVEIEHRNESSTLDPVGLAPLTNAEGLLQFGSKNPGIEVVGNVSVTVRPPEGEERFANRTYTRNRTVMKNETVEISLNETVVAITGQVHNASGDPAINDTVVAFARDASGASLPELSVVAQTLTNETGNFSLEAPKNGEYDIAYLQGTEAGGDLIPRDGSPDIHGLTQVTVSESDVSLDSPFQLDSAHDLNVSVVDESGSPVENATVAYFHAAGESYESSGVAGVDLSTNIEGLADVSTEEAISRTVPGLEVTGNVTVFVRPPEGEERLVDRIYERNRTVTKNETVEITINETKCVAGAVAGSNGEISLMELQKAINRWAEDTEVPGTGGQTIGLTKIQMLIDAWAKSAPVSCS